jgi:hypothetical protein
MSTEGGDGVTLHKITKSADIKGIKRNRHMDTDFLETLDPNPYPDPDSNESGSATLLGG